MISKFLAQYGHYIFLMVAMIGILYVSGSRIHFETLPDPRPRVLALFTSVPDGYVRVIDDIDGDTIQVEENNREQTVRLVGVDTPETKDPRKSVQCYGHEASAYTKSLVTGRAVKLLVDSVSDDRDIYQRELRYVQFEDGTTLNERLVYEGYAFAYEAYPNAKMAYFKSLEADAKSHQRGLWGKCQVTIKNNGKTKSTNAI